MGVELPAPIQTPNGIRLEVIRDFDELQKHAEAWNRLVADTGHRPELSHAWIATHLETRLNPGDSWFCLLAYDGQQLVGVLPVVMVPRRWLGRYKCLRFETPYDIFNTSAVEALMRGGCEEKVFPRFLEYLWNIPCACCCLRFRGLLCARLPDLVNGRLCRCSSSVTDIDGRESFIAVQGSAEEYFSKLSKKFLSNYHRTGRRIQEQPDVRFRFETGNTEVNAEQFMDIEHQGWKAVRKTSIRSDESYVEFFRLLAKRMEEQGWLRWAFLDIDGEPVAGQFMVQSGDTLYVVKIGYNENFSKLAPGATLFGHVIENTFESGCAKEINFMSGYSWLNDWNVQMRPVANVAFFPASVRRWGLCKLPMQLRSLINRNPKLKKTINGFSDRLFNKATA
jgi:CelD/BcsL family acetyltransferase involved in cellulose biosynthesis